jgi:hypothetical protein
MEGDEEIGRSSPVQKQSAEPVGPTAAEAQRIYMIELEHENLKLRMVVANLAVELYKYRPREVTI